jgi:hypothetical protein
VFAINADVMIAKTKTLISTLKQLFEAAIRRRLDPCRQAS